MARYRSGFLAVAVGLVFAAGVVVWLVQPRKGVVRIEVSGTPGLAIQGTADVDGIAQDLTGTVPTQFVLEGSRVVFSLTSPKDSGGFRLKAAIDGTTCGSMGSGNPPRNGVRGWVQSGSRWSAPRSWIEPYARDEQPAWLSPPP